MSLQGLIALVIIVGVVLVLLSIGGRREDRLRRTGVLPPEGTEQAADVDRLLEQGHKIAAIKIYRKLHGVDLKEAKEAVERREREIGVK